MQAVPGVELISLIAPTSKDRIAMIAREADGFLYVVSSLGVTGARSEIKTDLASMMETVRRTPISQPPSALESPRRNRPSGWQSSPMA